MTLTSKWRSWSSRGRGHHEENFGEDGVGPKSRALSLSWRRALLRCCGPVLDLEEQLLDLEFFFCSSMLSDFSSACSSDQQVNRDGYTLKAWTRDIRTLRKQYSNILGPVYHMKLG
jgi:hypothetical protein